MMGMADASIGDEHGTWQNAPPGFITDSRGWFWAEVGCCFAVIGRDGGGWWWRASSRPDDHSG